MGLAEGMAEENPMAKQNLVTEATIEEVQVTVLIMGIKGETIWVQVAVA